MSHNPYSPPKAEVADASVSALEDVEGRRDVYRACTLMWINFGIGLVGSIIEIVRTSGEGLSGTAEMIGMAIGMAIAFLIYWWFTSKLKLGRNWMRILITVLTLIFWALVPLMWDFVVTQMIPIYAEQPPQAGLAIIQWVASLVVLWLLYTKRSRDWFTAVNS